MWSHDQVAVASLCLVALDNGAEFNGDMTSPTGFHCPLPPLLAFPLLKQLHTELRDTINSTLGVNMSISKIKESDIHPKKCPL